MTWRYILEKVGRRCRPVPLRDLYDPAGACAYAGSF